MPKYHKQATETEPKADRVNTIKSKTLSTDRAKSCNAEPSQPQGYQLRYYDADEQRCWRFTQMRQQADVNEEENGMITAEALTAADPSAEDISAVSLSKLCVYYGGHENRSREG